MPEQSVFPDYNKNIVNVSATLAGFLDVSSRHKVLPALADELVKGYKNVVFLCFDGLGVHPLEKNLGKKDFLRAHIKDTLTSVFPSTTTNATTTLVSASRPAEHGWFAWSLYLEKAGKVVDLFCDRNHYDYTDVVTADFVRKQLPYEAYYLKAESHCEEDAEHRTKQSLHEDKPLSSGKGNLGRFAHRDCLLAVAARVPNVAAAPRNDNRYEINTVFPRFVTEDLAKNNHYFDILDEQFEHLSTICKKEGKQFVYGYNPQPDGVMHQFGVTSHEAKKYIKSINDAVADFAAAHPDTLLIITADHGMTNVQSAIKTWEDPDLLDLLEVPPYGDPRVMIVKVKKDKTMDFLAHMRKKYKADVNVYLSKALINKGVFGNGKLPNPRVTLDRLGDFMVVIKTAKYFRFCESDGDYKGMHTGLTPEEMLVPLIIVGGK